MSHDELILFLAGCVGSLLTWSLVRNIRAIDANIEKLWEKFAELQEVAQDNQSRIGVCEAEIKADRRRKQ